MYKLTIEDKTYSCQPHETVLDALLRENVNISYACKKGTCHSCMVRSPDTHPAGGGSVRIEKYPEEITIIFLPVCVIRNRT